ncbi:MAG: NAD(+) diphosphatase [Pararhodobacter sp.]|nr:NAD(+) diphosphatase [Pararhodobacter sp.]
MHDPATDFPVFSGGWDNRHAEWRDRLPATMAEDARLLPFWRGRPLLAGAGALGWIDAQSAVLAHAAPGRLFLGVHAGQARMAVDVSSWEPPGLDRAAMASFFDVQEYRHPALPEDTRFADLRGVMVRLDPAEAVMAATARALFNWHRTHRFCSSCGNRSDWASSGWQRLCPSCGARHFPRTDPVVIMLVVRGNKVLLGRSPGWPEGMYSALAGFVEPGESLEAAVRREVREETGIAVGAVRYIASQPWPWPNPLMLGFVAEAESEVITLDDELEDARWIGREELVSVLAGQHETMRRPRNGAIAQYLLSAWLAGRLG